MKMHSNVIWPLAHPLASHAEAMELYFSGDRFQYFFGSKQFLILSGGRISFRSFMNSFPHAKWLKATAVQPLFLNVKFSGGNAELVLFADKAGGSVVVTAVQLPRTVDEALIVFEIPELPEGTILLSFQVMAQNETTITDIFYSRSGSPVRTVSLAIVITTFNRPSDLKDSVETIFSAGKFPFQSEVIVINNGSEFEESSTTPGATVISNPNLGGSGGFARGLCEIVQTGRFSHTLFMDDDALCHPISIFRSAMFLSYAEEPNKAIAGAMLYSEHPKVQYELGAGSASYGLISINQNLDLSDFQSVLKNETAPEPLFGPWWYFMFPISKSLTLPFPFFVRGDDVMFCIQNQFDITTLTSVAAWQPSFEYKIGAATEYLATRSFLGMPVVTSNNVWSRDRIIEGFEKQFERELSGYRYAIVEAMLAAITDVMAGPIFWMYESNTLARIEKLVALQWLTTLNANLEMSSATDANTIGHSFGLIWHRLQARFGFFSRFKFRGPGLTHRMSSQPEAAAGRTGMIYSAPIGTNTFACRYNRAWERSLRKRACNLTKKYRSDFESLKSRYAIEAPKLQSEATWKKKFEQQLDSAL